MLSLQILPISGIEFMGREWDTFREAPLADNAADWENGAGFSLPGIGHRDTPWPSYVSTSPYGAANPTCETCGGRARGAKKCSCDEPKWKPIGKRRNAENSDLDEAPAEGVNHLRAYQRWTEEWAREALRVLKPGGHMLAFGGTRTHHRQTVAIEDAGFEVRDELTWVYLSGMPKSLNVSMAIDKAAGVEREVIGIKPGHEDFAARTDDHAAGTRVDGWDRPWKADQEAVARSHALTAPATDEAKQWNGYGTNLKPASEPIILARKPLIGTIAKNVLRYGTGALNIDATRIPLQPGESYTINTFDDGAKPFGNGAGHAYTSRKVAAGREGESTAEKRYSEEGATDFAMTPGPRGGDSKGRWPSNVVLLSPLFDGGVEGIVGGGYRSSGVMKGGTQRNSRSLDYGKMPDTATLSDTYGDSGGVSRIFIIPKAARSEKEPLFNPESLEDTTSVGPMAGRGQPGLKCAKCGKWKVSGSPCVCPEPEFEPQSFERPNIKNNHPCVKPIDLMSHLIRLVCPPGAIVLDPFAGSGSTLKAAELEGRRWIGIERDPHFASIIRSRLTGTQQGLGLL